MCPAGLPSHCKLLRWMKHYVPVLAINFSLSSGLAYWWDKERKYLIPASLLLSLGGTYVYSRIRSRDNITPNQAVIITGCDSGLGYSLAVHCRMLGAIVIAGVLNEESPGAKKLQDEDVVVYPLDVTKENSVVCFKEFVQQLLIEKHLELRCLVNNAGTMIFGEFEWQTEEQIRSQVEVNFFGLMRITREFMPIIRRNSSRVIIISSHCAIQPLPGVAAYSATKAAASAWATALRVELKKYGIDVVCFVPGSFTSESNILARQSEHFNAMRESMAEEVRNFYGDYFTRYAAYFSPMAHGVKPKKLRNPRIAAIFEGALLDKYPSAVYKCEPWRYFFYHTLFKITPWRVRDRLVERFVQLPPWKESSTYNASRVSASRPVE